MTLLNATDFGAVGDGVTDDTAAIQSAIDAAQLAHTGVFFPDGVYKLSSALEINQPGTRLVGESGSFTKLLQTNDNAHGINVSKGGDPTVWGDFTRRISIENLNLYSTGIGNSTGTAIRVDGTQEIIGQLLVVRGCTIRGWRLGYFTRRCDQCTIADTLIAYCETGIDAETGANSLVMLNVGLTQMSVEGAILGGGSAGVTVIGGDCGNQPRTYRIKQGAPVVIHGGNIETCKGGTEMILVETNASLFASGHRLLHGSGAQVPLYRVQSGGFLHVENSSAPGTLVAKESGNAVVTGNVSSGSITLPAMEETAEGDRVTVFPVPSCADNSSLATTASANTRGGLFRIVGRTTENLAVWPDGVTGTDDLIFHYRDAKGALHAESLVGRAEKGRNDDLTQLRCLNLGSPANPALKSWQTTTTSTGVYFRPDGVGLSVDGQPIAEAKAGGLEIQGGARILSGADDPEGNKAAPPGSLYLRTNGSLYSKTNGTGPTGWAIK